METIPSDQDGCVDPEALRAMLDERVRLIALTWLPANGGLINPAAAIGAVAREHGIAYFVDAAQAVGQCPSTWNRSAATCWPAPDARRCAAARHRPAVRAARFPAQADAGLGRHHSAPLGPDGTPMLRPDAARLESAEASLALRCGLANALREALDIGLDAIRARVDAIAQGLRAELATLPGVTVLDQGRERSGLVSFNVAGLDAPAVQRALAAQGVTIGSNGVSYTPLDMTARGLAQIARASVSYLTTQDEIGRLLDALRQLPRQG